MTDSTPPAPGLRRRLFTACRTLALAHVFIVIHLIPILGIFALICAVFPPALPLIAYDTASRAPLFALLALGPGLILAPMLHAAARAAIARLPRPARLFSWIALAIWLPVASGESIRWLLMQTQLASAGSDCHGTSTLLSSLRQRYSFSAFDGQAVPHGWMIRNGEAWLWSYRTLRFEHIPDWYRARNFAEGCGPRE